MARTRNQIRRAANSIEKFNQAGRDRLQMAATDRAAEPTLTVRLLKNLPCVPRDQVPGGCAAAGDVLELATSFANALIASNDAVEVT